VFGGFATIKIYVYNIISAKIQKLCHVLVFDASKWRKVAKCVMKFIVTHIFIQITNIGT
jgi:hypothetical protein